MATISTTTTPMSKSSQPLTKRRVNMATTKKSKKTTTNHTIMKATIIIMTTMTEHTPMMQINSHIVRIRISITQTVLMLSLKRLAIQEADYGRI